MSAQSMAAAHNLSAITDNDLTPIYFDKNVYSILEEAVGAPIERTVAACRQVNHCLLELAKEARRFVDELS